MGELSCGIVESIGPAGIMWPELYVIRVLLSLSLSLFCSLTLSYTSGGNVAIKNEESELIQLCALRKSALLIPLQSVYKS